VTPADHKWYRNWAIAAVLPATFESMAMSYPLPDLDVEELRRRLQPPNWGSRARTTPCPATPSSFGARRLGRFEYFVDFTPIISTWNEGPDQRLGGRRPEFRALSAR